ncbi:MAG TPA: CBS domain-containing protein [Thermoleophilaceae bacterium]|nr:CBS domain-containing protein [Thermoleophilaceae bacterium]
MSPRRLTESLVRKAPHVKVDAPIAEALRAILDSNLPAVPVVDAEGRLAGVFGEREFIEALFPGYLGQLKSASFVRRALDDALEKRATCGREPVSEHMLTEHIDVPSDASDAQIAETFFHHRVPLLPVVEDGLVVGVITRRDFFHRLAERVLDAGA